MAERQGQTVAKNMLGLSVKFESAPFFWSNHYDASILYVGHAEKWDDVLISGDVASGDCAVAYRSEGKTLAVATLNRPMASLEAELALERNDQRALDKMFQG